MSRDEFERDMKEYLRTRKRAGFNLKSLVQDFFPKKKPEQVELHEEVEVYEESSKQPLGQRVKEKVLTKFFKKEEPAEEEIMRTKMEAEDAISDMKEVSKIALGVVKQLPDEQLREFKQSEDFEKLKTILKKHELIK